MQNKIVAVNQFDGTVMLLKIDLGSGDREIVSVDAVAQDKVAFGMFELEEGTSDLQTVALIATPDGPLLLLNERQLYPDVASTSIVVKDEGQNSQLLVFNDGELVFELFYQPKFGIGLHPYLHEREDYDFYFWLSKNMNDPGLYRSYTQEIVSVS